MVRYLKQILLQAKNKDINTVFLLILRAKRMLNHNIHYDLIYTFCTATFLTRCSFRHTCFIYLYKNKNVIMRSLLYLKHLFTKRSPRAYIIKRRPLRDDGIGTVYDIHRNRII